MTDEQRAKLLALADRAEAATGADTFAMLEAAFVAVHGPKPERAHGGRDAMTAWLALRNPFLRLLDAGGFIDAALTLVPSGATYINVETCARGKPGQHCRAEVSWEGDDGEEVRFNAYGKEPAPTLVAAALRAIAKEPEA